MPPLSIYVQLKVEQLNYIPGRLAMATDFVFLYIKIVPEYFSQSHP